MQSRLPTAPPQLLCLLAAELFLLACSAHAQLSATTVFLPDSLSGVALPRWLAWTLTAGRLRQMIMELLSDPLYQQACQEKRGEIERLNPPAAAALEIERFVKFRRYVTTQL